MNYYKAKEQDTLPMLTWELVATSLEQLEALGLDDDPLVVPETRLLDSGDPNFISYEFGICHLRVQDNALVPTLPADITAAQAALAKAELVEKTIDTGNKLGSRTFSFDGHSFPLNDAAMSVYQAIIERAPATKKIISLEGEYSLTAANIPAFKAELYDTIIEIHEENVDTPPI